MRKENDIPILFRTILLELFFQSSELWTDRFSSYFYVIIMNNFYLKTIAAQKNERA